MKNCEKENLKDLKEIPTWDFKEDFEISCIQTILAKVTGIAMYTSAEDDDCLDALERCTALAVTLTDQIKYLNSETIVVSDNEETE